MKVHILSKELVKPSTPTPSNLRNYEISFTDELAPTINIPSILYYQSDHSTDGASRCNMLKNSLEQALTPFYPFAGRYDKNNRLIDCNDQGVEFVTAGADCQLTELLGQGKKLETELINQFLPSDVQAADEITDPLLAVQVTVFECGGIALAVCFSHRIGDASTIIALVTGWVAACRGLDIAPLSPLFNTASFYPGRNLPRFKLAWTGENGTKSVTKMFVFNREAISTLRGRAKLDKITTKRHPSRLQLVNAALLKALIGVDRVKYSYSRALFLIQTMNLRENASPTIPKQSFGNLWGLAPTKFIAGETEGKEFKDYADMLTDSVRDAVEEYTKMSLHEEDGHRKVINPFMESNEIIGNSEVNCFLFTSWCRFPYYDADFGWGTPVWVSSASMPLKNVVILMDTKEGDGIEAWVYLEDKDMLIFEQDSDIAALTK